jgi:hypothetical protein
MGSYIGPLSKKEKQMDLGTKAREYTNHGVSARPREAQESGGRVELISVKEAASSPRSRAWWRPKNCRCAPFRWTARSTLEFMDKIVSFDLIFYPMSEYGKDFYQ